MGLRLHLGYNFTLWGWDYKVGFGLHCGFMQLCHRCISGCGELGFRLSRAKSTA